MPAKHLSRIDSEDIYSHIYNKGVEKRVIFDDKEDYKAFMSFLEDYLTAPKDPNSVKREFIVNGRTFRGTPHQPKNYVNQVELVAYSLFPDHFHLLLHQVTKGSLESFIRSLCTRYSIYFNKKYKHTGALFEGPYKSVHIKNDHQLLYLTQYFHANQSVSSYPQYLGENASPWVKTEIVQTVFEKTKMDILKGTDSYKDFVDNYKDDQNGKELLNNITLDTDSQHITTRDLPNDLPSEATKVIATPPIQVLPKAHPPRMPEFVVASMVFFLLLGLGIRNITLSSPNSTQHVTLGVTSIVPSITSSPDETTSSPTFTKHPPKPSPSPPEATIDTVKPKTMVIVSIDDGIASSAATVNIREKPATSSAKIRKAKNGDVFEFIAESAGWYEVKLATKSGYILAEYLKKEDVHN